MSAAATSTRQKTGGRKAGTPNRAKAAPPATDAPKPQRGLVITYELLDELIPNSRNVYWHDDLDIAEKEASLMAFGWTLPIAVADGGLICGHARRQAAINLRAAGKRIPRNPDQNRAPVVDLSYMSEKQRRLYAIADNKMGQRAKPDSDMLSLELGELRDLGVDLSLSGFGALEIGKLLDDPDPEPEPAQPPATPTVCPSCGRPFAAIAAERAEA